MSAPATEEDGSPSAEPVIPPPERATDEQLRWLVESHGALAYKVAYAVTRNRAVAEEVVQDALFQAWKAMPSWDGDIPVRWLRKVTRNRAISVMRKESRSVPGESWDLRPSQDPAVGRVVEGRAAANAVLQALQSLDERSRTMLVLRETEDLSYEDIGEVLEMTVSAVKAKLFRARHALKAAVKEWEL
jgi:RNA polymerase sigma-70 factor (ECF subfamily)